jgi:uncharacterized protein YkwD
MFSLLLFAVIGMAGDCSTMTEGEAQIVAETNAARAEAGLPELVVDCRLMGRARRHANRMATEGFFAHSSGATENIASGQPHATAAVRTWLASPGHRANILSRRNTRIGVAGYVGRDGKTYWVQQFAP